MNKIKKFITRYGGFAFIRILFYPLTTLVSTPIRLIQTLWASRTLAEGKWGDYNRFTPHTGLNSLFYWTQAINFYRFGRSGKSPYLGLGNYPLSRWFHNSLPSLYAYWGASCVTVLFSMFGWWLFHLVWLEEPTWLITVMFFSLISTTFYANTFSLQNYNALGWLFFPLGLYGLIMEQWEIATIAWLLASFGSFTVVVIGGILSFVVAVHHFQITPLLAMFPAGLKLLTHLFSNQGGIQKTFLTVAKGLGLTRKNTKYKRSQTLSLGGWYFVLLYLQFGMISAWMGNETLLFWTGVVIFFVNSTYIRFADLQSMYMMMFSIATTIILQDNGNLLLLFSYWLLASPVPLFAGFASIKVLDVVPKLAPFPIKPFLNAMEEFLKPVQKGQRVLMAFDDPKGDYHKVFDGYRVLLELPLYVASRKEIHFMPDWWAVFETNYEGAPEFWGREIKAVSHNVKRWKADYVVIYQENNPELETKWLEAGFEALTEFSWNMMPLKDSTLLAPKWWLLKVCQTHE